MDDSVGHEREAPGMLHAIELTLEYSLVNLRVIGVHLCSGRLYGVLAHHDAVQACRREGTQGKTANEVEGLETKEESFTRT